MKLRDFFFFIGVGLALHQTASISQNWPNGWEQLGGTAIGVEGTFPIYLILLKRFGLSDDAILKASAAYQTAFLLVGIGVALGWMFDKIFKIQRRKI